MPFAREPYDVYESLVADLSTSVVPTSIMGATLVGVGILATSEINLATYLPGTFAAALASILKVSLVRHHRSRTAHRTAGERETHRFEVAHAVLTICMAASVGILGALLFQEPDTSPHLIATALLFAYCSGVVSRLSVRPKIAISAIVTAAVPCLVSAGLVGDMPHAMLALLFLVFLIGSMETVAHVHRNASRHISTRLQMASIARRDPLTGLLNRFGLREAFDAARANQRTLTLHAFDLDGFKKVNDGYGHEAGDQVLSQIADRLRASFVDGEIAARIGGDEFVVVQPGTDANGSVTLAARIHDLIVAPYTLASGTTVRIGASLGFTTGSSSSTLEGMLREADRTSYLVKRDGGGFRPHRNTRAVNGVHLPDEGFRPDELDATNDD